MNYEAVSIHLHALFAFAWGLGLGLFSSQPASGRLQGAWLSQGLQPVGATAPVCVRSVRAPPLLAAASAGARRPAHCPTSAPWPRRAGGTWRRTSRHHGSFRSAQWRTCGRGTFVCARMEPRAQNNRDKQTSRGGWGWGGSRKRAQIHKGYVRLCAIAASVRMPIYACSFEFMNGALYSCGCGYRWDYSFRYEDAPHVESGAEASHAHNLLMVPTFTTSSTTSTALPCPPLHPVVVLLLPILLLLIIPLPTYTTSAHHMSSPA